MRKEFFFIPGFLLWFQYLVAQKVKPPIDTSVYNKWPSVEGIAISKNGKYVSYIIYNKPIGGQTLVLESSNRHWKYEIPEGNDAVFSGDSRYAVFSKSKDSIGIVTLGKSVVRYRQNIYSYKLFKEDNTDWLAYQLNDVPKKLVLQKLGTGKEQLYPYINDYILIKGKQLLLTTNVDQGGNGNSNEQQSLQWVNLNNNSSVQIWNGHEPGDFVFDNTGLQLAFTSKKKEGDLVYKEIWYYKVGMDKARCLSTNGIGGVRGDLEVLGLQGFGKENSLFFTLRKKKAITKKDQYTIPLTIWSYLDTKLPSQRKYEADWVNSYTAVVHIRDGQIFLLQEDNERLILAKKDASNWALIEKRQGNAEIGESNWNKAAQRTWQLISTNNGYRKFLNELDSFTLQISPTGKYLIYYDPVKKVYFSYETDSGTTHNITNGITTNWLGSYRNDLPKDNLHIRGIAGWLEGDDELLIYDRYDIWKIDPLGQRPPVNLTNGYGKKYHIVFYLTERLYYEQFISNNGNLLLTAFNLDNKNNGFFKKDMEKQGNPEELSMGPYIYEVTGNPYVPDGSNFSPMKSKAANVFIVRRMSASESPNYFSTTDFKKFIPLSELHPEKQYNWYTTELHTWTNNNTIYQGSLYKPENFDPTKKYPLIFYYYERLSDALNAYIKPKPSDGRLNIAWYVSNGYLVFCPDIHYKLGEPGRSALNAILAAVNHLRVLPFIDVHKMGLQGISFGGFETNYIVTHSNLFAAAVSASGASDIIAKYGSLRGGIRSSQDYYEEGQGRMGLTLWDCTEKYIENSPVFRSDKIMTPLLLMHTTADGAVPFSQALAFFTALRRLGKIVWLLEYSDGNHSVNGQSALDFSVRMAQFFDHYLKDKPAPLWMTRSLSEERGDLKSSLRLDDKVNTPGPGLLITK